MTTRANRCACATSPGTLNSTIDFLLHAPRMGAPSLPPGRYFRMHMVGYFEEIDSERGPASFSSFCSLS